jgi:SAM-dependent methyltransferase
MEWFEWDFDHPAYFAIYHDKVEEAREEGPALARLLDLPPGSRVLDLPCGWGRLRPHLEARQWEVLGGDLSAMNLRRHLKEFGEAVARLDLRALPFQNASADGILCAFTSWGYFATEAENVKQLSEFSRVLSPNGVLLLDLCGRHHLEAGVKEAGSAWRRFDSYRERIRWNPDGRRILTERKADGERFCHDIWIPTDAEIRAALAQAGFRVDRAFGGLQEEGWHPHAERWIYRAIKL